MDTRRRPVITLWSQDTLYPRDGIDAIIFDSDKDNDQGESQADGRALPIVWHY